MKTFISTNSKASINTTVTVNDKLVTYSKDIANGLPIIAYPLVFY